MPRRQRKYMDESHPGIRSVLRVVGPLLIVVGLGFTVVGLASFFSSFGSGPAGLTGGPDKFWCAFVGLPLLGVGLMISKFAFLGAVSRYVANEVAPVGRDTFGYVAEGIEEPVRNLASAVGEGLREASGPAREMRILRCHKCNTDNETPARYCKSCGAALAKSRPCAKCGELNDPDARFCDNCGTGLG